MYASVPGVHLYAPSLFIHRMRPARRVLCVVVSAAARPWRAHLWLFRACAWRAFLRPHIPAHPLPFLIMVRARVARAGAGVLPLPTSPTPRHCSLHAARCPRRCRTLAWHTHRCSSRSCAWCVWMCRAPLQVASSSLQLERVMCSSPEKHWLRAPTSMRRTPRSACRPSSQPQQRDTWIL